MTLFNLKKKQIYIGRVWEMRCHRNVKIITSNIFAAVEHKKMTELEYPARFFRFQKSPESRDEDIQDPKIRY